jgi:hypothetical protein
MEVRQIFLPASNYQLDLEYGDAAKLEWKTKITSKEIPWIAVVISDEDLSLRKEIYGSVWEK